MTASGLPIRQRIRLRGFHYGGACAYYLTICAFERRMLFGTCRDGIVSLDPIGQVVQSSWRATADMRPDVVLDEHIVMPNHMHAILHLSRDAPRKTLFSIIAGFKSDVTSTVRAMLSDKRYVVWQKRFHDRVIRSGKELEQLREYIRANPARWCGAERLQSDARKNDLPL